jgi:toxin CcdB
MAQFQVYRIGTGRLVLDLQTDLVDTGTRVVAPLLPLATSPKPLTILEPVFEIEGVAHVLHTAEMAAVPAGLLRGAPVADLTGRDYEIRRALDMVFSGF